MSEILHHGATSGVTGSCHELNVGEAGILIDCGLFQGQDEGRGASASDLSIDFSIDHIRALVVTHVHIDHVGRIPYLLAAGFDGPIICSEPSAIMLPEILEDALKIGFTRDRQLIERVLGLIRSRWCRCLMADGIRCLLRMIARCRFGFRELGIFWVRPMLSAMLEWRMPQSGLCSVAISARSRAIVTSPAIAGTGRIGW